MAHSAAQKAYAKLNLTLDIVGEENGYHMIDSAVCSVDLYDLIKLKKRRDNLVSVEMHGFGTELMPPDCNNAYKAAELYVKTFGVNGADIVIYKNIPLGAGMGGSSADAAGVLRGMAKLYGAGSEKQLKELADSLGSDAGYMLTGGFARLSGRGEKVTFLKGAKRLHFLVLLPPDGVSTAECYKLCGPTPESAAATAAAVKAIGEGDTSALGKAMGNGLFAAAEKLNPQVKTAYNELAAFDPYGVCMTGSGSAVFALFENAEFCAYAKSRYRGKFRAVELKSVVPKI